jgi:hypothetical protein
LSRIKAHDIALHLSFSDAGPYIGVSLRQEFSIMPRPILAAALLLPALLVATAPAAAQDAEAKVNQLIVYGNDPCPPSTDNEITVCARKEEAERYRIPEPLRESSSPQNDAWNNRVIAYEAVGATGTLSCSPVGGGGFTGCLGRFIDTAYAEKAQDPNIRFSQLIAEERARRLASIDQDAADMQARVEQAEREYEARQRNLQDPDGGHQQPDKPAGQ